MIENTIQSIGTRALSQYAQSQTAGRPQGLFSTTLETAGASVPETAAQTAAPCKHSVRTSFLPSLAPLLLSGLPLNGEAGILLFLLALAGKDGGLLSEPMVLGETEAPFCSGLDGNGLAGRLDGSAAVQATAAAAQSLLKAYQSAAQSGQQGAAGEDSAGSVARSDAGAGKAPGRAVSLKLTSVPGNRNPVLYRSIIDGFDVENNPRYAVNQKGAGDTYCNIFLWDVTSAMGAEIPHYTDRDTGAPAAAGAENALRMNANRMTDWLNTHGPRYGWHEVGSEQAQALANRGCPAVAVWKNREGGHGHVQVISPSKDGAYDPDRGVAIAQAGRLLRNYTHIREIYSSRMAAVQYFAHR